MSDNIPLPSTAFKAASDEIGDAHYQRVKLTLGADGVNDGDVSSVNPMPVQITNPTATGLTDSQLRATPVPVSGTVTANTGLAQPLTDTQLRATAVPVSGTVELGTASLSALENINVTVSNTSTEITNDSGNPIPVSGAVAVSNMVSQPLTDTQLRATPVSVSGTVTANTGLTQPLTDTQLRATPVPVSGTVTANTGLIQPLTDTQLRATPVPISMATAPTTPVTGTFWQATQPVSAASLPLPTGAATESTLSAVNTKLPTLSSGRIPVELPAGSSGLTDAELRASPVPVTGTFNATATVDDTANMVALLRALVHPIWEEASTGRLRVVLDPLGGAQTLGTVTTVSTVSNQTSMGGVRADTMVYDNMHSAWASSVRRAVS